MMNTTPQALMTRYRLVTVQNAATLHLHPDTGVTLVIRSVVDKSLGRLYGTVDSRNLPSLTSCSRSREVLEETCSQEDRYLPVQDEVMAVMRGVHETLPYYTCSSCQERPSWVV